MTPMYATAFTRPLCASRSLCPGNYAILAHRARRAPITHTARPILGVTGRRHASALAFSRPAQRSQFHNTPQKSRITFLGAAGVATVGIGLTLLTSRTVHCEPPPVSARPAYEPLPPPPQSTVNIYELSFGTVCGICAGVFIKKGAKALAFVFGGVFVLLQYLGKLTVIKVDWSAMGHRFENLFYTTDPVTRTKKPPTIYSLYRWIVDFLTADFQQRASFVAGLALGLRIG